MNRRGFFAALAAVAAIPVAFLRPSPKKLSPGPNGWDDYQRHLDAHKTELLGDTRIGKWTMNRAPTPEEVRKSPKGFIKAHGRIYY